ncbi:flagellar basal body rod protein FlgC [bacterium]|nr:flagellar basal body rod protein FlgC [bacterium]
MQWGIWALLMVLCCPVVITSLGLDEAIQYSATGVIAQRVRMNLIAQNIANLTTFKVEETGLPYQKQYAVLQPSRSGVRVQSIEKSNTPFVKQFDPDVPQADEDGYVYYTNVNLPEEMTHMNLTESLYEANISAFKVTKTMYQATIDAMK